MCLLVFTRAGLIHFFSSAYFLLELFKHVNCFEGSSLEYTKQLMKPSYLKLHKPCCEYCFLFLFFLLQTISDKHMKTCSLLPLQLNQARRLCLHPVISTGLLSGRCALTSAQLLSLVIRKKTFPIWKCSHHSAFPISFYFLSKQQSKTWNIQVPFT